MEYVILVNRTSKNLEACWNGKRYALKPGDNPLPARVAEAAKRQNPLKGSGADVWSLQYLVGIKEQGDDIYPIEQSDSVELYSQEIHGGKRMEVVQGTAQSYRNVNRLKNEDGPVPDAVAFEHNPASDRAKVDLP